MDPVSSTAFVSLRQRPITAPAGVSPTCSDDDMANITTSGIKGGDGGDVAGPWWIPIAVKASQVSRTD